MSHSSTAEFMALFRALESRRPREARLFCDPLAERFLRPSLRGLCRVAQTGAGETLVGALDRLWPGARASGIARTRWIDDRVLASLQAGARQLVLLGAGFDCRAHRLASAVPGPIFEVDRPATQRRKAQLVGAPVDVGYGPRYVPCDFENDALRECLEAAGFDGVTPTVFVLEGVTNYLSTDAVDALFADIRTLTPASWIVFTYVDAAALPAMQSNADGWWLRQTLRAVREPWTFGIAPEQLEPFLSERGFDLLEDVGSADVRRRYGTDSEPRGYEFYRFAVAATRSVRS
ncbi:MAG: SAM-dependent methyltransferase [Myxococcota bacterium]